MKAGNGRKSVRQGWVRSVLVVLVIGLLSFELGSIAFYGVTRHQFFYGVKQREQSGIAPHLQVAEAVFHPYLAFINRVGRSGQYGALTYTTNNHGWQFIKSLIEANPRCCDYPTKHEPDELIVGIFGGSVSGGFSLLAQASPSFARRFEDIPKFAGKRIRILNFAMAGFRQPQQLQTLAYYLSLGQEFDVVINLDGFNEVVTSSRNWASHVEPTYPADTVWGEMGRHLERSNLPLTGSHHLLAAYHERAETESRRRAEWCRIASCFTITKMAEYYHQFRHSALGSATRSDVEKVSLFPVIHRYTFDPDIDIYQYIADRWADSSLAMAKLMDGREAIFLHVLQPNQWYRKSGEYKPIDRGHIYKWVIDPVNRGYAAMIERLPRLKAAGVNVLDATLIFKDINNGIYDDDCCHYTKNGYDILFGVVAGEIGRLAERRP
jgi:hypothetical protein